MILSLHTVQLEAPLDQGGESLVLTELILPRNAIARKAALKEIRLSRSKSAAGSLAKASFARAPFYEKALLKEKVDGPFGLKVSLTRPLKHPELSKLLRQLLTTAVESSTDLLASFAATHSLLDDLLEEAGDALVNRVADTTPTFLATGGLDLDSARLASGTIDVPLKLTQSLRQSDLPPGPKSREKRRRQTTTYRKGHPVGQVSFQLDVD